MTGAQSLDALSATARRTADNEFEVKARQVSSYGRAYAYAGHIMCDSAFLFGSICKYEYISVQLRKHVNI